VLPCNSTSRFVTPVDPARPPSWSVEFYPCGRFPVVPKHLFSPHLSSEVVRKRGSAHVWSVRKTKARSNSRVQ